MANNKNCCGFADTGSAVRTAGLFFFVFPAYAVFCAACLLLRLAAGRFGPRAAAAAGFFREMRRVSLALLNDSLACGARCALSGRLVGTSPLLAGAVYRYAVPALMGACWVLLVSALGALL